MWNNRLVQKWERSTSRLYIVNLLFNLYAEYIMTHAGLDEVHAVITIARRNINTSDMQLTPPCDKKWRGTKESLDDGERGEWTVKEESEKAGLTLNIQKTKIMASGPITSWQIMGKRWKQWQDNFLGSKITADGDCSPEIKRLLPWGRKAMTNL